MAWDHYAPVVLLVALALLLARSPANRESSAIGRCGWVLLAAAILLPGPEHGGLATLRLPIGLTAFWWIGEGVAHRRRGDGPLALRTEEMVGIAAASLVGGLALNLANGYAPNWYWAGLPAFPFARFAWLAWTWMVIWPGILAWHYAFGGRLDYGGYSGPLPRRLGQAITIAVLIACLIVPADQFRYPRLLAMVLAAIASFAFTREPAQLPPMRLTDVVRLAGAGLIFGFFFEWLNLGSAARRFHAWPEGAVTPLNIPVAMLAFHLLQGLFAIAAWPVVARWLGLAPAEAPPGLEIGAR